MAGQRPLGGAGKVRLGSAWPVGISEPHVSVLQVRATDADSGSFGLISYSLGTGLSNSPLAAFSLGEETGQLCTRRELDRDEGLPSYDFTVTAMDGVSGPWAKGLGALGHSPGTPPATWGLHLPQLGTGHSPCHQQ